MSRKFCVKKENNINEDINETGKVFNRLSVILYIYIYMVAAIFYAFINLFLM